MTAIKTFLPLRNFEILPEKINKMLSLNNLGFIDVLSTVHPESPLGGIDTNKQNSSDQLAGVCLSSGHLAAKL